MMMKKVVILGGKGTAVVIAEQIYEGARKYGIEIEVLGFAFDDPEYSKGINGWPVLCGTKEAYEIFKDDKDVWFVFAMYRSDKIKERANLCESYGIPPERWLTFIHPEATVCRSASLGYGTIVLAQSVINSNVKIGNHNIILSGSIIEHDTEIGNHNFMAAHSCIGSGIKIGNYNFLGLNATYRTFVEIGNNNIIGMSSVVLHSIGNDLVLAGNPARILRRNA